jgi:hypothetical protein
MAEHNIVLLTAPWTLARAQAKLNMGITPAWDRMGDNLSPLLWDRFSGDGSTLDRLCTASPDPTTFMCTLFFAHLLDQSRTPPQVVQWLEHKQADISRNMTCSPRQLHKGCWRTIAVPLAHMHKGYMNWMLVGTGPDLDLFPLGSHIFDNQAIEALHTVRDLVDSQWNTSLAVCPLAGEIHAPTIAGPSLGLPVYLGAAAARNHVECSNILATGKLDPDGSVREVGHVREKADAAGPEIRVFIHPAGEHSLGSPLGSKGLEYIPVTTANEAYAAMRFHTPGLGMKVASAQYTLDHGQNIIQELCGLVPGMEAWVRHNCTAIARQLHKAENLQALVQQIRQWAHATTGICHGLAHALLDCFTPHVVQTMGKHDPQGAWDMVMLQIKRANHWGRTDLFSQWNSIATRLQPHIECLRQGDEETLLLGVLELINESHNRYDFVPDLPQRMEENSLVRDMTEAFEQKCRRI